MTASPPLVVSYTITRIDVVFVSNWTKLGALEGVVGTLLTKLSTMLLSLVPMLFVTRILNR